MHLALTCHPDTPCAAVARIDVNVQRPKPGLLALHYVVSGNVDELLLPALALPERTDDLWKHTCLEAFVMPLGGGYGEFNFASSTQWAAYRFTSYRAGMQNADIAPPAIEVRTTPQRFDLQAQIALSGEGPWRLALSAVIEEKSGAKSYWALRHPTGKPDFHHADSFAYEISP